MRTGIEQDELWNEFHRVVNMSSQELRTWLLTEASGERAFEADMGHDLQETGERVVRILGKRKQDLAPGDTDVMRRVVDFVHSWQDQRPAEDAAEQDEEWRRLLMSVGHDPLKP